jgi:hypothetical protein
MRQFYAGRFQTPSIFGFLALSDQIAPTVFGRHPVKCELRLRELQPINYMFGAEIHIYFRRLQFK